ncbi:MAG: TIGR04086 family membrane protein [Oscillospiraceae bacterium]|jgi:putative membrane protein (TIGR04086 family)|nr:TIGR04086 family membrane protein [Oscillospiraceae bacterium]
MLQLLKNKLKSEAGTGRRKAIAASAGLISSIAALTLLYIISAVLTLSGKLPEGLIPVIATTAAFFAALCGGLATAAVYGRKFLLTGLCGGAVFAAARIIAVLFAAPQDAFSLHTFALTVLFAAAGALGGLVGAFIIGARH